MNYLKTAEFRKTLPALTALLLILSFTLVPAQQKPVCDQCKQAITGKYLRVDGKVFHSEHFLCAKCGKIIPGVFKTRDSRYYHVDCYALEEGLICAYCNKILQEEYLVYENKKYHKDCLKNNVLERCSVCGQPIEEDYIIDSYKNKYHAVHKNEYKECDCCGRLICGPLTGGGVKYSDGRNICNKCYRTAVTDSGQIEAILSKVKSKLISLGLAFGSNRISIKGVDKNELRRIASNYKSDTRGYCNTQTTTETLNGKITRKTTNHQILVLNGIPGVLMESIIAHELMHAWLNDNTHNTHTGNVKEGSCNYISYLYLRSLPEAQSAEYIRLLEESPDPVYGGGFREIKSRFYGRYLFELLNYLRK